MHFLIGFAVIVGLIAFAFGETAARYFVGTALIIVGVAATAFVIEVLR